MSMVALSDSVATGLIGAGAALAGAIVGGAASFGGTWWEQRNTRMLDRAEAIRTTVAAFIEIYGGAPVRLTYAKDADDFDDQLIELRTRLWTPRAQLRMHSGTKAIDDVMHRIYFALNSLDGQYPIGREERSELIRIVEELADVTARTISQTSRRIHQAPERS